MSRTEHSYINRQSVSDDKTGKQITRPGSLNMCEALANTGEVELSSKQSSSRRFNLPKLDVDRLPPATVYKPVSPVPPTACSESLTLRSATYIQEDISFIPSSDRYELTLGNPKRVTLHDSREQAPLRSRGDRSNSSYETDSMGDSLKYVKQERSLIEDKIKSLATYYSTSRDFNSDLFDSPYSKITPRKFQLENAIDFSSPEVDPSSNRSVSKYRDGGHCIEHEVSKIEKLCADEFIDTESVFSAYSNIDKAYGVLNKVYNKVLALQQDNNYLKKEVERLEKKLVIEKERYDNLKNAYGQDRLGKNERYELQIQIQSLKNENETLNEKFENCVNLLKREKQSNESIRRKIEENEQLVNSLQDKVKAGDIQDDIKDRLLIEKKKIDMIEKILGDKKLEIDNLMKDKEKLIYDNQILKQQTEHDRLAQDNLKKINEKLIDQLDSKDKDNKEIEKKNEKLRKDVISEKEKLEHAQREIKEYVSSNEKLKVENAKIKQKNSKADMSISELNIKNAALAKELEKMKLEKVKYKAQIDKLEQLNSLIENQVKTDQARCVQLARQHDETLAENRKIQTENNKLNMLNQNLIENLKGEREKYLEVVKVYEAQKAESMKAGGDISQFHKEKASLAEQLLSGNLKVENLQETISYQTSQIDRLSSQLDQAKVLLKAQENLKNEIERLKSDLISQKQDSFSLESKLSQSSNEVHILQGCIENYKQLLKENQITIQKMSSIIEYKNREIKTLSVISVQVQCLRQENVKKQQELHKLHSLLQGAEVRFNTVYSSYQKLDDDYKHILQSQPDIKDRESLAEGISNLQDLLTQERELNQNLEIQLKEQSIMIKELSEMEDDYKIILDENEKMRIDLDDYEENIKYVETEKLKIENLQLETQKCIETYKEEVKSINETRFQEINMLTDTLQKNEKKNNSLMELLENQRTKISELTEELNAYQDRGNSFNYPILDIDHIKKVIQEHIQDIIREHQAPLNTVLLSIKNNEGKILSLEAKFFQILNYIRKLKETKILFETQIIPKEQREIQLTREHNQLQADKEKYEQIMPQMANIIKSLEFELVSTRDDLKTAEKEIVSLTSKFNQLDAGDYSIFIQDITGQLLAREKEVDVITSECNRLRKEYAEMSLNKEEVEEYLAIVPLQKLKLKELQEQLSSNIRDLEDTLSSKNDEITRMSMHNQKLGYNVNSMAKSIEYQSVVILDLQKHLRDIEGFYLLLQKKLYEMIHSIQTEDIETFPNFSKDNLQRLTDKLKQLDKSLSVDLAQISEATQIALDRVKYPQLFIDLDKESLLTFSSGSDTERFFRLSCQPSERNEQFDLPFQFTLKPLFPLEKVIESDSPRSNFE